MNLHLRRALFAFTIIPAVAFGWAAPTDAATATLTSPPVKTTNYAGYSASSPAGATTVKYTLKAPTVTCPAGSTGIVFGGFQGFWSGPAGSIGTQLQMLCNNGVLQSTVFDGYLVTADGTAPPANASVRWQPGETVTATMTRNPTGGTASVVLKNVTTKYSATASGPFASDEMDSVMFGLSTDHPVPQFSNTTFSAITVGGATLASLNPARFEMWTDTTQNVATNAISSTGSAFTLRWVAP